MTAREVLERLTFDQRADIAIICMEMVDAETIYEWLRACSTDDELMEIGLRIKKSFTSD